MLLGGLGVVECLYAGWLLWTLPTYELASTSETPEAFEARALALREAVRQWEAQPFAEGIAFFDVMTRGDALGPLVARFNETVPDFYSWALAGLAGTIAAALVWVLAAIAALHRPQTSTSGAACALAASTFSASIVSEPLLGHDMFSQFMVWQLPGSVLALVMLLAAPRDVPWTLRFARWTETRVGAVVTCVALLVVGVLLSLASLAASRALGTVTTVVATGPIVLGVRLVLRAFSGSPRV